MPTCCARCVSSSRSDMGGWAACACSGGPHACLCCVCIMRADGCVWLGWGLSEWHMCAMALQWCAMALQWCA